MYQFTVEAESASDLRSKLLDLARVLAAGEDSLPVSDAWFGRAIGATAAAAAYQQQAGVSPEEKAAVVAGLALDSGEFIPAEEINSVPVDAEALRTKIRAALSPHMTTAKAAEATALIKPFGSVSKIPTEKLADVLAKAEAL